jgi:magnesium transporter
MATPRIPAAQIRRIPVVLAAATLGELVPAWRTIALTLTELGAAAFFISGTVTSAIGGSAPWFVLAAVVAGMVLRAVDVESWALFMPGGLPGRVNEAFGRRPARFAAASVLVERLLFAALVACVAGHYTFSVLVSGLGLSRLAEHVASSDLAAAAAASIIGILWIRSRVGRRVGASMFERWVWVPLAALLVTAIWGQVVAVAAGHVLPPVPSWSVGPPLGIEGIPAPLLVILAFFVGFGVALPAMAGGDSLARRAAELPQPRLPGLRRTARLAAIFGLVVIAGATFAIATLMPPEAQIKWDEVPLVGLILYLPGNIVVKLVLTIVLAAAGIAMLSHAADTSLDDATTTLQRLSRVGVIPEAMSALHRRFGTSTRLTDVVCGAAILLLMAGGGHVSWLSRAYAVALVCTYVVKILTLRRLRGREQTTTRGAVAPAMAPGPLASALQLFVILTAVLSILTLLVLVDPASWAGTGMLLAVTAALATFDRHAEEPAEPTDSEAFQLLTTTDLALGHAQARPGGVLVPVRHLYSLSHVGKALHASGDRDVVVMTVRVLGVDVEDDAVIDPKPTSSEKLLLSQVVGLAERHNRAIQLLIVPARDVFDAIAAAIHRLRSSEIHVGESTTLSADVQARLLGEAWERIETDEPLDVRLVIHHLSGRTDTFYLGAHAPSLTSRDLNQIHRLWLDASKAVGPHVHHHDVVRAALTQMEQQLTGPERDRALAAIKRVARPADELAAVVRRRDFSQLRDMIRNRPPNDLAEVFADLSLEDQVVVFRLLPRKDAAATFEYLSHDEQTRLLKAMAQEDVAALLNEMAPDDRTMFLEELPATVTRQLLALLTPQERAVASTLLGYPEGSIGRLMTPNYVSVREDWTVQGVLDYIREHGQDSETLNVIYVVDEQGLLIDDIRIRDFLLTSPSNTVQALMDRHFVALKATDDQASAVAVFREHDRSALPVTDTSGMLIGIVTIDDVLDVAEAVATKEIQRIGGSEALDEPYMEIAFLRMVQKRAGWLTVLFIGEMFTATAMGVFEKEIAKAVVLALFIPLVISSGGNAGSQAATLVIRALALGEVTLGDWWRIMRRELMAGLALGTILGAIGLVRIIVTSAFFPGVYGAHPMLIAATVGVALVGIVLWGSLIGSLLPVLLRRLGFDPATSSAPFVATLVDVTGLVIYFSVGMVILRGSLL